LRTSTQKYAIESPTEAESLQHIYNTYVNSVKVYKIGMNPMLMPTPSWWSNGGWTISHKHSGNPYTHAEALDYLNIAEKGFKLALAWRVNQCDGGKEPHYCSYVSDIQGTLSQIHGLQNNVRDAINKQLKVDTIIPEPALPTPEPPAPVVEQVTEKTGNYFPIIIGVIVAIVIIIILLRRA